MIEPTSVVGTFRPFAALQHHVSNWGMSGLIADIAEMT
jgi:hypothetical protein